MMSLNCFMLHKLFPALSLRLRFNWFFYSVFEIESIKAKVDYFQLGHHSQDEQKINQESCVNVHYALKDLNLLLIYDRFSLLKVRLP